MNIDLPTQYDPKSVEAPIYKKWLEAKVFHAAPDGRENRFSIVIPPPNVTGALHLGHAINGTIQDILTRYHRMKGDNTLWMPGIDHAGIATQAVVEKTIFEKEKKSRHDLGREELVRRIWEWKEQFGARILSQLQAVGESCDWDRARFTLDEQCAKAVREAFFKMFKDGLIFRGKRLVNWDTHLQTAVADDEIYHETVKGQLTSIKYPVAAEGNSEFLIVATTRPETMLGDTAVAVHPDDPRYKHLIGKQVILPLVGRKIPVIADGLLVDPKFGTGVVKVTPAHDPNDYATGVRHGLEQINLLTPDGKVNENGAGEFADRKYSYVGMKFATAARKAVLADLEALGLIAETKVHEHEVGHSDRSKTPIEPYLSDQWFVRMGDVEETRNAKHETRNNGGITLADGTRKSGLAQAAMDAVTDGRVKITPERYAKGYLDWLGQKRDWCISRQLWWGHRIPVWSFQIQIWEGESRSDILKRYRDLFRRMTDAYGVSDQVIYDTRDDSTDAHRVWLDCCSRSLQADEALIEICAVVTETRAGWDKLKATEALGGDNWHWINRRTPFGGRDPDVLDTWFSSALWPLSTMGWPEQTELLKTFYPTSVLSTARDILTLWVARMVMFGLYCHGDVPFRNVYIHPVIQDGEGKIMSKSKGNGVDPVDIINSHGADAMRFTLASMATETQDIRMPVVKDPKTGTNTSPKFDIGRNFSNKIWNASRFILSNVEGNSEFRIQNSELKALEDRWILSRLHATIKASEIAINGYHFAELAQGLYQFFWTDLCDWYLEISKARIKTGDAAVQAILLECLTTSLKLLHPMMPFITEEIWGKLPAETRKAKDETRNGMIVTAAWPVFDAKRVDAAAETQIAVIQAVTSAIREIQNRYPAAKGKDVVIKPRTAALQAIIEASRGIIEPLASAKIAVNSPTAAKPEDAATSVLSEGDGAEIYIGGVIDKTAETAKLKKRRDELGKFIAGNKAKLGNEAFVGKAPEKVVQGLRDQLGKQEEELAAVEKNLAELGS